MQDGVSVFMIFHVSAPYHAASKMASLYFVHCLITGSNGVHVSLFIAYNHRHKDRVFVFLLTFFQDGVSVFLFTVTRKLQDGATLLLFTA
jgi:hypothetical protein